MARSGLLIALILSVLPASDDRVVAAAAAAATAPVPRPAAARDAAPSTRATRRPPSNDEIKASQQAAIALAHTGSEGLRALLKRYVDATDSYARNAAKVGLTNAPPGKPVAAVLDDAVPLLADPRARQFISEFIAKAGPDESAALVRRPGPAGGMWRPHAAIPSLRAAISSPNPRLRRGAVRAIAGCGGSASLVDPALADALVAAVAKEPELLSAAASAIRFLESEEAITARAVGRDAAGRAIAFAAARSRRPGSTDYDTMKPVVLDAVVREPSPFAREAALRAAAAFGDPAPVTFLPPLLSDPDPLIRRAAARVIVDRQERGFLEDVDAVASHKDPWVALSMFWRPRDYTGPDAQRRARRAVESVFVGDDVAAKLALLPRIGTDHPRVHVDAGFLINCFDDPSDELRVAAARAAMRQPGDLRLPAAFSKLLDDRDPRVRTLAGAYFSTTLAHDPLKPAPEDLRSRMARDPFYAVLVQYLDARAAWAAHKDRPPQPAERGVPGLFRHAPYLRPLLSSRLEDPAYEALRVRLFTAFSVGSPDSPSAEIRLLGLSDVNPDVQLAILTHADLTHATGIYDIAVETPSAPVRIAAARVLLRPYNKDPYTRSELINLAISRKDDALLKLVDEFDRDAQ